MVKAVKYGWVMFRTNSSSSDGDWEYREVVLPFDRKAQQQFISDIDDDNNWSEQYRGCDVKLIKSPPKSYLLGKADGIDAQIKRLTESAKRYRKQAKTAKTIRRFYVTMSAVRGPWIIEDINFPAGKNPWGYAWKVIKAYDSNEARDIANRTMKVKTNA